MSIPRLTRKRFLVWLPPFFTVLAFTSRSTIACNVPIDLDASTRSFTCYHNQIDQLIPKPSNHSCIKTQELYLGDVVHLGELEGDAQATEERRDERAGSRERRDIDVIWRLGIHGGFELLEGLGDFPQRLMVVISHLVNFGCVLRKMREQCCLLWFLVIVRCLLLVWIGIEVHSRCFY